MVSPVRPLRWYGALIIAFGLGWWSASLYLLSGSTSTNPKDSSERGTSPPELSAGNSKKAHEERATDDGYANRRRTEAPSQPLDLGHAFREAFALRDLNGRLDRLRGIIGTLSAEQMTGAIEAASRLPQADQDEAFAMIGRRWAEIDAKGALAFVLPNGARAFQGRYGSILDGILDQWASTAPRDAVAWAHSLPPGGTRSDMIATLIHKISRGDPRQAFEIMQSQGAAGRNYWAVERLFASWAETNPQAAMAAANQLKGDSSRPALAGLARIFAENDPYAAIAWANGIQSPGNRKAIMNIVAEQWSEKDPAAVIAWSNSIDDEELRRTIITGAISQLATRDLPAAYAQIRLLPEGEARDQAIQNAANALSSTDLRAAIQMLDNLPPTPEKASRLAQVCAVWADSEPRAALDWLYQNTTPGLESGVVGKILNDWMQQEPDKAFAWVQALPAGEKRESALTNLTARLVSSDPARAQQLFAELPADAQTSAARRFSASFVRQDLDKAISWAEGLPPGSAQGVAFGIIASKLAESDSVAAARWVDQLPAGLSRDNAVIGFSDSVASRDPEGALTWALTISNPRDREQQVEVLAKRWMSTNATEAREWLRDSPHLTNEQKYRIRGE